MFQRMQSLRSASIVFWVLAAAWLVGCGANAPDEASRNTILVDNIHSPKRVQDAGMGWNDYRYSSVHGQKRLFDFLADHGYTLQRLTRSESPQITSGALRGAGILLIDQIALDCTDYAPDEVDTIVDFVRQGGSLLAVVDHTNVYDHARRANAILEKLGVRVAYATAVERSPSFVLADNFWVVVRSFKEHPTTRGLQAIFVATGAPLATPHGVGFLSEHGFADAWMPNRSDQTLVGNGIHDPSEETGRLPVVAAGDYGRGRFIVLGDENMMGNSRLFLADNFELVANSFEWLAHRESEQPPLRERMTALLRVGFDLEHCNWNIAGNDCDSYLPFYTDFNRGLGVVSRGLDTLGGTFDVLVFTDPVKPFEPGALDLVRAHLTGGGTVLLLTDVVRSGAGSIQLLQTFVPDLALTGERRFGIDALPASATLVTTVYAAQEFPLSSSVLPETSNLHLAGHEYPPGTRCAYDIDRARPYLRRLTVAGGEAFLQADIGPQEVDIARLFAVGRGRLVVFFQDGAFRNETLGWERLQAGPHNEAAHRVVFEIVRWLKALHQPEAGGTGTPQPAAAER